jgi:hypothetical protein
MEETNEEGVILEYSPEEVVEEFIREDVKTPTESEPRKTEEKVVPYDRFKKVNDELKKLKEQPVKEVNKALDVEDYIDISASLDGLDSREKEYLAKQHKLSGKPLKDIRNNEDFILWQSAYRAKADKERKALEPTSEQIDAERPKSLSERLKNLPLSEQEKILVEKGLYKSPKRREDTVFIKK